jgi:hypothetical protein
VIQNWLTPYQMRMLIKKKKNECSFGSANNK